MISFSEYANLQEQNVSKLKHLTHIEEAIIHLGFNGARESIEILRSIRDTLKSDAPKVNDASEKFDGAPSLVFGIDPSDGEFFVGTKGVFAKTPKLVKTKEDLDTFGYSGELREKLTIALKHLPKLGLDGILQGDMMFTQSDLKTETIDGNSFITFTPNTITYAVPADSELAKDIRRAKIGIVIHTTYVGQGSLENMTATPGQVDLSNLTKTPDVWYDDPYIKDVSGKATLTKSETLQVNRYLSTAGKIFQSMTRSEVELLMSRFEELPNSYAGMKIDTFINSLIRNGRLPEVGKGRKLALEYQSYLESYFREKVLAKLKTEKTKQQKREFFENWILRVNFETIGKILNFIAAISEAKKILIDKLTNGMESMSTFVWDETSNSYRVTSGEGFVITDKLSQNTWKLVDRAEFSRLNFSNSSAKFGQRRK